MTWCKYGTSCRLTVDYHLLTTGVCNLSCTYCGNGESGLQRRPSWTEQQLEGFLSKDEDAGVILYGGEPLLNTPLVSSLMDRMPVQRWTVITNGTQLYRTPEKVLRTFDSILLSVDGRKETTDACRGEGTYERALDGARVARERGFSGDLIARMTVSEHSDIEAEVRHLLDLGIFDHVHWQLNVLWTADPWKDLESWVRTSYNPGISRLVSWWADELRQGRVPGIVPFLGISRDLVAGTKTRLRCGSGIDSFSIFPDGTVTACPVVPDLLQVGDISSDPLQLRDSALVGEPCTSCPVLDVCGGRCLVANRHLSDQEEFPLVCSTITHLISQLRSVLPTVRSVIDAQQVDVDLLDYPKYNNSCEIIP